VDDDTAALTGALAAEKAAAVAGAVASACTAGVAIAQTIHVSNLARVRAPTHHRDLRRGPRYANGDASQSVHRQL
jgi:hypothetical protein